MAVTEPEVETTASAVAPEPAPVMSTVAARIADPWGSDGDAGDGTIRTDGGSSGCSGAITDDIYGDIRQRERAVSPVGIWTKVMREPSSRRRGEAGIAAPVWT